MAKTVGRSGAYVMTLQKKFGLPACKDYSEGYVALVRKLIYLLVCSVPDKDIKALLSRERKLLELLKVDSLHDGRLWFEDMCRLKSGPTRLLLSGHDLGQPVDYGSVQTGLDFSERDRELFEAAEMGASALRELQRYSDLLAAIRARIARELPVVEASLKWGQGIVR